MTPDQEESIQATEKQISTLQDEETRLVDLSHTRELTPEDKAELSGISARIEESRNRLSQLGHDSVDSSREEIQGDSNGLF